MSLPRTLIASVGVVTTTSAVLADLVIPDLAAQHSRRIPYRGTCCGRHGEACYLR